MTVNVKGHPVLAYQPVKFLFQVVYTVSIIVRLPLWIAISSIPLLRPHPKWNAKQTFLSRLIYSAVDMESRIGISEPLSLEPGKEGDRFQVLQPSDTALYQGPLKSELVEPVPVGGTWFPDAPKEDVASKTIALYIHGGAFIKGDGRDGYCGFAANTMVAGGGVDAVYALQYRLSGWLGYNPFPAALQDALTAYLFLLKELKIPSQQVVLYGDSAGANVILGLLRYIHEFGTDLKIPPPRYAFLASPWVAPLDFEIESNPRFTSDFLPRSFLRWGALTYTASQADPSANPYITPLGSPFPTVPLYVNAGTAEIFFDIIEQWVSEMKQIGQNLIELHQEDSALHDTLLVATLLGWEKSAQEVVSATGAFAKML